MGRFSLPAVVTLVPLNLPGGPQLDESELPNHLRKTEAQPLGTHGPSAIETFSLLCGFGELLTLRSEILGEYFK